MASGVTFRTPGPPDADRVFAFLCQNFFPDAPIIRYSHTWPQASGWVVMLVVEEEEEGLSSRGWW